MIGLPPELPSEVKQLVNELSGPVTLTRRFAGAVATCCSSFGGCATPPPVAWAVFNLALLVMGMSMTDPNFAAIVAKPDNVPIVGLVFLLGFFTWLATYKAVVNDDRIAQGLPPLEKIDNEKVLVWPDLVYTEMICMVALTAFLVGLGDRPASSVGRAGQPRQDAQSVEGPVVLPRPAGNARLLRSVDGGRRAAERGDRWA